jgi:hypothetical protein
VIRGLREPVRLTSPESLRILDLANIWAVRTNNEVTLVSANDHVHSAGSAHYAGLAVDLHASNPDGLARALQDAGYRVLWRVPGHFSHIHAEVTIPALTRGTGSSPRGENAPIVAGVEPARVPFRSAESIARVSERVSVASP